MPKMLTISLRKNVAGQVNQHKCQRNKCNNFASQRVMGMFVCGECRDEVRKEMRRAEEVGGLECGKLGCMCKAVAEGEDPKESLCPYHWARDNCGLSLQRKVADKENDVWTNARELHLPLEFEVRITHNITRGGRFCRTVV
jgi:hypothetical protein